MMSTNVAVNWNELLAWAVMAPDEQSRRAPSASGTGPRHCRVDVGNGQHRKHYCGKGNNEFTLCAWLVLLVSRTVTPACRYKIRGATLALRHPCLPAAPTGCGTGRLKDFDINPR